MKTFQAMPLIDGRITFLGVQVSKINSYLEASIIKMNSYIRPPREIAETALKDMSSD